MANLNGYSDTVSAGVQTLITGGTYVDPTQWWVGLFTANIDSNCSNLSSAEVPFSGAYARVQINAVGGASPAWSTPGLVGTAFRVDNVQQIQFAQATGNWGTITYAVVCNAQSSQASTNGIFGGALAQSKPIDSGTTAVFLANALAITTVNATP